MLEKKRIAALTHVPQTMNAYRLLHLFRASTEMIRLELSLAACEHITIRKAPQYAKEICKHTYTNRVIIPDISAKTAAL